MFTLTLNDGSTYEVLENSTMTAINYKGTATKVAELMGKFTTENLKNATIVMGDGTFIFSNYIATGGSFTEQDKDGNITATFTTREKTDMEVMQEEIKEMQDALIELA